MKNITIIFNCQSDGITFALDPRSNEVGFKDVRVVYVGLHKPAKGLMCLDEERRFLAIRLLVEKISEVDVIRFRNAKTNRIMGRFKKRK